MSKKKTIEAAAEAEKPEAEIFDPFVGGDKDDDLSDMQYVQDENQKAIVDTMPPDTKEDAERAAELEDPTPVEEDRGNDVKAEGEDASKEESEETEETTEAEEESGVLAEAEEEPAEEPTEELAREPQIPKHRFDEISDKLKKRDEELEALRQQIDALVEDKTAEPEPEPYDYETKEKEALDAVLEGDAEKYARIQSEIRAQLKTEAIAEAKKNASQGDESVREQLLFEETGAKIEAEFPQLDVNSEQFEAEARQELIDLYVGYAATGQLSRAEALQKAAEKVVRMYDYNNQATEEPEDGKVVKLQKKKSNPKKKQEVADKQPPVMEGTAEHQDEPKFDFSSMSDEEFEALPEATKRRARGDIL